MPQVCEKRFGTMKGILIETFDCNIYKTVNYSGHRLARRLELVAPAYLKKDSTPHSQEQS